MLARRTILSAAAVSVLGLVLVSQSLSQPGQRGQRQSTQAGPGARQSMQGGPGGRQFEPAQMRQMMEKRMQEMLGATEQEWKVLGPRVMKVEELNRQTGGRGRGGMMMFGGMGRRGPGGPGGNRPGDRPGAPDRALTAAEKVQEELQTLLDNTSTTPEQIKQALTKFRAAKEKAKQDLAKAQQDLRQVLTIRQEAQLVVMGLLD